MTCFRVVSVILVLLSFSHAQLFAAQSSSQLAVSVVPEELADVVIVTPIPVTEAEAPIAAEEYKKQREDEIQRAEIKQKQHKRAVRARHKHNEPEDCSACCMKNCCTCITKKRSDCLTDWTLQGLKGCCYGATAGSACLICWTSLDPQMRYDTCILPTAHDSLPVWIACLPVAAWCSYFVTRAVSQRKKDQ